MWVVSLDHEYVPLSPLLSGTAPADVTRQHELHPLPS